MSPQRMRIAIEKIRNICGYSNTVLEQIKGLARTIIDTRMYDEEGIDWDPDGKSLSGFFLFLGHRSHIRLI